MAKYILLAAKISTTFESYLRSKNYLFCTSENDVEKNEIEGIVTSNKLVLDKEKIAAFEHLKWIARLGSGMEIIDTDFCKEKNIFCFSSPLGISNAVAEHVLGMLIGLQKNIATSFIELKNKQWIREPNRGFELQEQVLGIIGYGNTGKAVAQKFQGLCKKILVYDKYKISTDAFVQHCSLEELQKKSTVISFHLPLNKETFHYYNEDFANACQHHILINTSRGEIVSNEILLKNLASKKITGACLDVLENENKLTNSNSLHWHFVEELLNYKVILTPHIAGYTFDAIEKMSHELQEQLEKIV